MLADRAGHDPEKIAEYALTGVVICSCSPRMHEQTFRKACEKAGLNGYMVEIANIREQCSWIHKDKEEATEKAVILGRAAIAKVQLNAPLTAGTSPVTKRALVIGGGIAGIQTALDIAEAGFEVDIVEKEADHRRQNDPDRQDVPDARLRGVYPDAENGRLRTERKNPYLFLLRGRVRRRLRRQLPRQDPPQGALRQGRRLHRLRRCTEKCPQKKVPNEFNLGLDNRRAIYIPFAQAVPKVATIDANYCNMLKNGKCGVCAKVCHGGRD